MIAGAAGLAATSLLLAAARAAVPDGRKWGCRHRAPKICARDAGLATEAHVPPEIGHAFSGSAPGRLTASDVTVYKSLGSIVQDLACATWFWAADRD